MPREYVWWIIINLGKHNNVVSTETKPGDVTFHQ